MSLLSMIDRSFLINSSKHRISTFIYDARWSGKNVSRSETVTQQKISKQLVLYSIHMQTIYTIFQTKMPKTF